MAKRLFQQSLSDHCVGRSLSFKRSWRTVPVARYLTNVSVCFIQLSKSCGESVLLSCKSRSRAGKRGLNKSCSAVTASYSSVSKGISKSNIILISASLIRHFRRSIVYEIFNFLLFQYGCAVPYLCISKKTCVSRLIL